MTKQISFNIIYCCIFFCSTAYSQQIVFEKTYGFRNFEDIGTAVKQTIESEYIIAAYTDTNGLNTTLGYLLKLNTTGDTIWTKIYVRDTILTPSGDYFKDIIQTSNNEYLMVGRNFGNTGTGGGAGDVWMVKTDSAGNEIWNKDVGGIDQDEAFKVIEIKGSEEYLIMGRTKSYGAGDEDIYLLKIDNNGDTLWTKTIGTTDAEIALDIKPTYDGNYVISAWTGAAPDYEGDALIVKIDSAGNVLKYKVFTTDSVGDAIYSIYPTSDGGYLAGGQYYGVGNSLSNLNLLKVDSNLNKIWERLYGNTSLGGSACISIFETSDGGFNIHGGLENKLKELHVNNTGDSLWSIELSGNGYYGYSSSMTATDDGGIIVAGFKNVSGKGDEIYVAKIDSVGYVYSCKNNLVVNFNADNVSVGDTVFFIDSSTTKASSYLTNWQWNFGDGKTDTIQNPYHIYTYPDTLSVSLYIKNNTHCEDSLTKDIIVGCAKPTAGFNTDTTIIQVGDTVRFTELSVFSPYDTLVSRLWNLGDGTTDTVQNPVHVYSTTNAFTVQLIVTTNYGCTDTLIKEKHIVVECPLITAGFAAETTLVKIGQSIKFTDLSTIQRDTITNWLWNFGDGATDTVQNPIHKYTAIDTFTVQLIITSNWGCSDTLDMIDYIMVKDTVDGIQTVKEEKASMNVFPNPFNNSTIIQYSLTGAIDNAVLAIYNIAGQEVFIRQIKTQTGEFEIGSTQLVTGAYYIKLKVGDRIMSDKKLIFVR